VGTVLTIVFYILIAAAAYLVSQSVFMLINYFTFHKPFIAELKKKGLAKPGLEQAVTKGSLLRGLIIFALGNGLSLALAFNTYPGGLLVYGIVLLFGLLILKPARAMYARSNYNISCFINKYKDFMNITGAKNAYAEELTNVEPILQKR